MANTTLCGLQYTLHICVWYRYIVYSTLCTLLVYILKIKVSFIYKKNKRLTYHSQTSFLKLTFFIHCCAFCLWWLVTAYDGLTVVFACLQLHVDKRVEQLREKKTDVSACFSVVTTKSMTNDHGQRQQPFCMLSNSKVPSDGTTDQQYKNILHFIKNFNFNFTKTKNCCPPSVCLMKEGRKDSSTQVEIEEHFPFFFFADATQTSLYILLQDTWQKLKLIFFVIMILGLQWFEINVVECYNWCCICNDVKEVRLGAFETIYWTELSSQKSSKITLKTFLVLFATFMMT